MQITPAQTGAGALGAAVVLPVPPGVAASLAVEGGVPAAELHLTLAYLPAVDRTDAEQFEALRAAVAAWAAGVPPVAAALSGVGRFTGDAGDGDAFVALADAPGLAAPREALVAALAAAGFEVSLAHGFNPHVTLRYLGADEEPPLDRIGPLALVFEGVEVWRGAAHDAVATFTPPAEDAPAMHRNLRPPTHYGAPVELSIPPTDDEGGPWSVIAYAVELKGYKLKGGGHAKITAQDIDEMVANFARYPKAPLVIEHADTRRDVAEVHPEWARPHGHVVALRRGTYARVVDGVGKLVPSLEARLAVPPDVRLAINGDPENDVPPTWPFCSITPAAGIDEENDRPIGTVLWSLSLTAHPRLTDLPRLAAARSHAPMKNRTRRGAAPAPATQTTDGTSDLPAAELGYWYGEIKTRGDVLSMLRSVFDLPVLTVEADVVAKLGTLESLAATPEDTSGVDVDDIVGELRRALGLDALKTTAEVIAAVRQALATLPAGDAPAAEMSRAQPRAANPAPTTETKPMKTMLELAAEMKIPAATEDAARDALVTLARDGAAARAALNLPADQPLVARLTPVLTDAAELPKVREELAKVQSDLKARADAEAKAAAERAELELSRRVDEVCAAKGYGDDLKPALLAFGRADRAGFDAKYPAPSAAELAQRAQDPARLENLHLSKPPATTGEDVGNGQPGSAAERLKRHVASLREVNPGLTTLEATAMASRGVTAEAYAREFNAGA